MSRCDLDLRPVDLESSRHVIKVCTKFEQNKVHNVLKAFPTNVGRPTDHFTVKRLDKVNCRNKVCGFYRAAWNADAV